MNRSIVKGDCDFFFDLMRNKVMCEERAELYFYLAVNIVVQLHIVVYVS